MKYYFYFYLAGGRPATPTEVPKISRETFIFYFLFISLKISFHSLSIPCISFHDEEWETWVHQEPQRRQEGAIEIEV